MNMLTTQYKNKDYQEIHMKPPKMPIKCPFFFIGVKQMRQNTKSVWEKGTFWIIVFWVLAVF